MRQTKRKMVSRALAVPAPAPTLLKLDLGCGPNKAGPEWTGVDSRPFDGKVDVVCDLSAKHMAPGAPRGGVVMMVPTFKPWPWKDDSVDEVRASHFVEHLDSDERVHFCNELWRVLKPGAKAQVITPHWASGRAYGDLTHKWPPVCEFWFYYLSSEWRANNAPHNDGYRCNFACGWGHNLHPAIAQRNQEYQQHAVAFWKEAAQDLISTWTKVVPL